MKKDFEAMRHPRAATMRRPASRMGGVCLNTPTPGTRSGVGGGYPLPPPQFLNFLATPAILSAKIPPPKFFGTFFWIFLAMLTL